MSAHAVGRQTSTATTHENFEAFDRLNDCSAFCTMVQNRANVARSSQRIAKLKPDEQIPSVSTKTHLPYFDDHAFIPKLIRYQKIAKLRNTYVGLPEHTETNNRGEPITVPANGFWQHLTEDHYIHPSFILHRTVTGRTASVSPNGQNFPKRGPLAKQYRKIFIARPGYTLIEVDLSQAELRIAAWMANEPTMLAVYNAGGDIHMSTALIVSNLSEAAFELLPDETKKDYRQKAKAAGLLMRPGLTARWRSVRQKSEAVMNTRKHRGQFKRGAEHPKAVDLKARFVRLCMLPLGTLRLTGNEIVIGERSRQMVQATCSACTRTWKLNVDNVMGGKTTNCRCQRGRKYASPHAAALGNRYDAAKQRCTNPKNPSFPNYGGRGIKLRFTRAEYIAYVLNELPRDSYTGLDVDRRDNDGHYEPGNLRLVSRAENSRNKRSNRLISYGGMKIVAADLHEALQRDDPGFRLSKGTTAKLAARGASLGDISTRRPRLRRLRKRKGVAIVTRLMGQSKLCA